MRVDIFVEEAESDAPFASVLVYENHEEYNLFKDYAPSRKERPA
jgi:hypothetical protein